MAKKIWTILIFLPLNRSLLYLLTMLFSLWASCVIDLSKSACVHEIDNSCSLTSKTECENEEQTTYYPDKTCKQIDPAGFCRVQGNCLEQSKLECESVGGIFSDDDCETEISGACSLAGDCLITDQQNCENNQGLFTNGTCPGENGACLQGGSCIITSESSCSSQGGIYLSGACSSSDPDKGACINNSGCSDNVSSCSSGTFLNGQTCLTVTGKCVDFSDSDECVNTVAANCNFPDDFHINESCPVFPPGACVDPWACTNNVTECVSGTLVVGGNCSTITGSCEDFFTSDCTITTAADCDSEDDFTIDGTCP